MNKKILKTIAGITVVGAALGGAFAYIKKCKEVNDLGEEDFDDLWDDEEDNQELSSCTPSRSYTTIPSDTPVPEPEEAEETDEETSDSDASQNSDNSSSDETDTADVPNE